MSTANPVVIGYDNFMSPINTRKILAEFPIMVTAINVQVTMYYFKNDYYVNLRVILTSLSIHIFNREMKVIIQVLQNIRLQIVLVFNS